MSDSATSLTPPDEPNRPDGPPRSSNRVAADHGLPAATSDPSWLHVPPLTPRSFESLDTGRPIKVRAAKTQYSNDGFHCEVWVVTVDDAIFAIVDSKSEAVAIVETQVPEGAFVELSRELLVDLPPRWAATRDGAVRRAVRQSLYHAGVFDEIPAARRNKRRRRSAGEQA